MPFFSFGTHTRARPRLGLGRAMHAPCNRGVRCLTPCALLCWIQVEGLCLLPAPHSPKAAPAAFRWEEAFSSCVRTAYAHTTDRCSQPIVGTVHMDVCLLFPLTGKPPKGGGAGPEPYLHAPDPRIINSRLPASSGYPTRWDTRTHTEACQGLGSDRFRLATAGYDSSSPARRPPEQRQPRHSPVAQWRGPRR